MTPAALYLSSTDRDPLFRDELLGAARTRDMTVVLEVEEVGSGATNDRPGLRRVIDAARVGQLVAVLVWRLDQLGDSVAEVLHNVCVLRDAGCRLVIASHGLEVPAEGVSSDAFMAMLDAFGELHREIARQRARRWADEARGTGKRIGRPTSNDAPDGARVHELRQKGRTWGQIARRLSCTTSAARRAFKRLAEHETTDRSPHSDENPADK